MHHLRVRASSPYVGMSRTDIDVTPYPGVSIVSLVDAEGGEPTQKPVAEGDLLLVRGDAQAVGKLAGDMHLAIRETNAEAGNIADTLFNRSSGLAEIVIPPRSALIGQTVFPGMTTHDGDLIILAVQRGGYDGRRISRNCSLATTFCCRERGRHWINIFPIRRCWWSTLRKWSGARPSP